MNKNFMFYRCLSCAGSMRRRLPKERIEDEVLSFKSSLLLQIRKDAQRGNVYDEGCEEVRHDDARYPDRHEALSQLSITGILTCANIIPVPRSIWKSLSVPCHI